MSLGFGAVPGPAALPHLLLSPTQIFAWDPFLTWALGLVLLPESQVLPGARSPCAKLAPGERPPAGVVTMAICISLSRMLPPPGLLLCPHHDTNLSHYTLGRLWHLRLSVSKAEFMASPATTDLFCFQGLYRTGQPLPSGSLCP